MNFFEKKILTGIVFFITSFFYIYKIFFPSISFANEKPQIIFINQIRGKECCSIGTLENLKMQVEAFEKYQIPSFFALRYDTLID